MDNGKPISGVVNLHKPRGITSRQAVDCVKRLVRPAKTGHAGTLDPLASGVLVVCVGPATRLIEYVQAMPKRYLGTFLLGRESETEDTEGEVRVMMDARQPDGAELRDAAARFVGPIQQRPPVYSALKVGGRRAYDLARAGKPVELAARQVLVHHIEVVSYDYPELVLDVECGSGTYIRSLGRDLAEAVGSTAVMSALTRTAIGCFKLDSAHRPEELSRETVADWLQPPLSALGSLVRVMLSLGEIERVRHGLPIARPVRFGSAEVAAVDADENLLAILGRHSNGTLRVVRNFSTRGERHT
jgi:tRNA pseudouridine55 synthase